MQSLSFIKNPFMSSGFRVVVSSPVRPRSTLTAPTWGSMAPTVSVDDLGGAGRVVPSYNQ